MVGSGVFKYLSQFQYNTPWADRQNMYTLDAIKIVYKRCLCGMQKTARAARVI